MRREIDTPGYRIELSEWNAIYKLLQTCRDADARISAPVKKLFYEEESLLTDLEPDENALALQTQFDQLKVDPVQLQKCMDLIGDPYGSELQTPLASLIEDYQLEDESSLPSAPDIFRLQKARGAAQQIFRKMMLRIYDKQCAFCGFSMVPALEAAHIKPWKDASPTERLLPTNGLLLCGVHHRLFDAGLMTLSEDHIVEVTSPESLTYMAKADDQYTVDIHGTKAHVPFESKYWPAPEFLTFRKELIARFLDG